MRPLTFGKGIWVVSDKAEDCCPAANVLKRKNVAIEYFIWPPTWILQDGPEQLLKKFRNLERPAVRRLTFWKCLQDIQVGRPYSIAAISKGVCHEGTGNHDVRHGYTGRSRSGPDAPHCAGQRL